MAKRNMKSSAGEPNNVPVRKLIPCIQYVLHNSAVKSFFDQNKDDFPEDDILKSIMVVFNSHYPDLNITALEMAKMAAYVDIIEDDEVDDYAELIDEADQRWFLKCEFEKKLELIDLQAVEICFHYLYNV